MKFPIVNAVIVFFLTFAPVGVATDPLYLCGNPPVAFYQGGSSGLYSLANSWGNAYGKMCGVPGITTGYGYDDYGARVACGLPVMGWTAIIGFRSQPLAITEATLLGNGDYLCKIEEKRTVREIPVANFGIAIIFPLNQDAAKCAATLPGKGFTTDQLRWMFSSLTESQLRASGDWDPTSVPNSDNNDNTYLWSELGGSGCPNTKIAIAGISVSDDIYDFFTNVVFKSAGETIALNRPNGVPYFSNPIYDIYTSSLFSYLKNTPSSIGFVQYSPDSIDTTALGIALIENKNGVFVAPSPSTLGDGSYDPFSRQVYFFLDTQSDHFQTAVAFVNFCLSSDGDALTLEVDGFFPLSASSKTSTSARINPIKESCFPETSMVQVMGKGVTAMKDVKLGDYIMSANGKFDKVYSFGHYAPDMENNYLQIHATGLTKPLEISKEHMLFVEGMAVPASAVSVGDKIDLAASATGANGNGGGGVAVVKKIQTVILRGVYAPFTMSGTLAVNDVATSAYVDLHNDSGVLIMGGYKTPLSMHWLMHMFQAHHRLVCTIISPTYCQTEMYDEHGMSSWVVGPLAVAGWFIQQNVVIMTLVFIPFFLLGALIYGMELLLSTNTTMILAVVLGVALLRIAMRSMRKGNKKVV